MKPLKQKIEEAAEKYDDAQSLTNPFSDDLYEAFKAGAQFLLDEGVRFSEEDMRAAFTSGMDQILITVGEAQGEEVDFEEWLKEREQR